MKISVQNGIVNAVYPDSASLGNLEPYAIHVDSVPASPGIAPGQTATLKYSLEQGCYWEVKTIKRIYSKYKIVAALGDNWPVKKAQIESAGLWELWNAANELASDNATFQAFYSTLSDAEKTMLEACRA